MQAQGQFVTLREGSHSKALIAPQLGGWLLRYARHFPGRGFVDALHFSQEVVARYPNQMYAGCPLLFPLVSFNHCGDQEHHYEWQGTRYPMPQHGFARRSAWRVVSLSETSLLIELAANRETLAVYPFEFRMQVLFELVQGALVLQQRVDNFGEEVMPFSTGIHPYVAAPFSSAGSRGDCSVLLPAACKVSPHGLWDSWTAEPLGIRSLPVSRDVSDTLFLTDLATTNVGFDDPRADLRLRLDLSGAPHHRFLALWAKSAHEPYYCIEPWTALPNPFSRADSELILLGPGEVFNARIRLVLEIRPKSEFV